VPVEVLDRAMARARRQLGPAATQSDAMRLGLALVAEVDPDDYRVIPGRPPGTPGPRGPRRAAAEAVPAA
jgi:hypothetical protein